MESPDYWADIRNAFLRLLVVPGLFLLLYAADKYHAGDSESGGTYLILGIVTFSIGLATIVANITREEAQEKEWTSELRSWVEEFANGEKLLAVDTHGVAQAELSVSFYGGTHTIYISEPAKQRTILSIQILQNSRIPEDPSCWCVPKSHIPEGIPDKMAFTDERRHIRAIFGSAGTLKERGITAVLIILNPDGRKEAIIYTSDTPHKPGMLYNCRREAFYRKPI